MSSDRDPRDQDDTFVIAESSKKERDKVPSDISGGLYPVDTPEEREQRILQDMMEEMGYHIDSEDDDAEEDEA